MRGANRAGQMPRWQNDADVQSKTNLYHVTDIISRDPRLRIVNVRGTGYKLIAE